MLCKASWAIEPGGVIQCWHDGADLWDVKSSTLDRTVECWANILTVSIVCTIESAGRCARQMHSVPSNGSLSCYPLQSQNAEFHVLSSFLPLSTDGSSCTSRWERTRGRVLCNELGIWNPSLKWIGCNQNIYRGHLHNASSGHWNPN